MKTKSLYLGSFLCPCCPITWAMEHNPLNEKSSMHVNPAQLGDFNTLKELCLREIPPSQIIAVTKNMTIN